MRSSSDVEVRRDRIAGQEVPARFVWRGGLWTQTEVVAHRGRGLAAGVCELPFGVADGVGRPERSDD